MDRQKNQPRSITAAPNPFFFASSDIVSPFRLSFLANVPFTSSVFQRIPKDNNGCPPRFLSVYREKIQMYYYFCTYSTYPYLHSAECLGLCNSPNRYQGRKNREYRARIPPWLSAGLRLLLLVVSAAVVYYKCRKLFKVRQPIRCVAIVFKFEISSHYIYCIFCVKFGNPKNYFQFRFRTYFFLPFLPEIPSFYV